MPSEIAWVDIDEDARDKMRGLLALLKEKGAVDELGLGTIRQAFSDRLFPGTSTQWDQPKYLLLVPWVYLEVGAIRSKQRVAERVRNRFRSLARQLSEDEFSRSRGVIGITGVDVQLTPDVVVWNALSLWGIRQHRVSREQALQACGDAAAERRIAELKDEPEIDLWHPRIYELYEEGGALEHPTLTLSAEEAKFFAEQVGGPAGDKSQDAGRRRDSLLAQMLLEDAPSADLFSAPWDYPAADPSDRLRSDLELAELFSAVAHGVRLIYALMVVESRKDDVQIQEAHSQLEDWAKAIGEAKMWERFVDWSRARDEFAGRVNELYGRKVGGGAFEFLNDWSNSLQQKGPDGIWLDTKVQAKVRNREISIKQERARLRHDGTVGRDAPVYLPAPMTFRWQQAKLIVDDISNPA